MKKSRLNIDFIMQLASFIYYLPATYSDEVWYKSLTTSWEL